MEADTTVSKETKDDLIKNVLNGAGSAESLMNTLIIKVSG